jgi:nucleoside triphosphate diphosphatase
LPAEDAVTPSRDIARLIELMAALRNPQTGCPWDLAQRFETIAPYTVEEAYEVVDAIARDDLDDLRDELGDLLLQVVFHARMAEETGAFDFGDVVHSITAKLVRRHPHVFDEPRRIAAGETHGIWDRIKAQEKADRAARRGPEPESRALGGVPPGLPALARARKLQERAAAVGFDWSEAAPILGKIREETAEAEAAVGRGDQKRLLDEIGDLLFAVVNLARHAGADPEIALRSTNAKFERRFGAVERGLEARGKSPAEATLEEMEELWQAAKTSEAER